MLPLQPGRPERRTHDYLRRATMLLAALEIVTGQVTARCPPRHRYEEFLRLVQGIVSAYPDGETGSELQLVIDSYAAHKCIEIRVWLAANPRIQVRFTPTGAA